MTSAIDMHEIESAPIRNIKVVLNHRHITKLVAKRIYNMNQKVGKKLMI